MFPKRTYFAPDEPAAGEPPAAPEAAPPAEPVVEAAPEAPAPEGVETPPEAPAAPSWEDRITEWGGEDTVVNAVELHKALQTREGVQGLAWESLRALGIGDEKIAQLFDPRAGQPAADPNTPAELTAEQIIAEMQSDPERVVTGAELLKVMAHQQQTAQQQTAEERHAEATRSTIHSTLDTLQVAEADRELVLSLGNRHLPNPGDTRGATPEQIAAAIQRGHEELKARVEAAAKQYVTDKGAAHDKLPTPLPSGSGGGGEALPEPANLAEASKRVRAALGIK